MKSESEMISFFPIFNRVGHFVAFVHSPFDVNKIEEKIADAVENKHYYLDCICFVDCDITVPLKSGIPCKQISAAEEKSICSRNFIPLWISDENIFNNVLNHTHTNEMPRSAEIVPSMLCCFSCNECAYKEVKQYYHLWRNNQHTNTEAAALQQNGHIVTKMSVHTAETVIKKLADAGVKEVAVTGGGDPLCNIPATLCCLKEAKKYGMDTGIYTNGYFLDRCAKELLKTKPNFIRISVYGVNPSAFSKYTQKEAKNYEKIIENIEQLVKMRDAMKSETRILLSMLVTPELTGQPEEFFNFLKYFDSNTLNSLDGIRLTPLIHYENKNQQISKEYLNTFFDAVDERKVTCPTPPIVIFRHRLQLYEEKKYKGCEGSHLYAEVGPDGGMYFCCEHNLKPSFCIGNLMTESVEEIWKRQTEHRKCINTAQCPAVCKPHEYNNFIYQVACFPDETGIRNWRDMLKNTKAIGRMA